MEKLQIIWYTVNGVCRRICLTDPRFILKGGIAMAKKKSTGIPGLTVNFSWKRALGITAAKQKFARKTGIPTTKQGLERKIGRTVLDLLNPNKKD